MDSRADSGSYLLLLTEDIPCGLSDYDILGYGCYACSWKGEEYFIVGFLIQRNPIYVHDWLSYQVAQKFVYYVLKANFYVI